MCDMKDKQICHRTFPEAKTGYDRAVKNLSGTVANLAGGEIQPGQLIEWFAVWFQHQDDAGQIITARKLRKAYAEWLEQREKGSNVMIEVKGQPPTDERIGKLKSQHGLPTSTNRPGGIGRKR